MIYIRSLKENNFKKKNCRFPLYKFKLKYEIKLIIFLEL